ncbi:hypothetical protein IFM89_024113 [Coptis chinensis]|uniref:F-box domain-containing protein n=1 Tax=Coptis chinensis TaxID=261450 RepID=A0A835HEW2_9MAGN|nr:hypothetical protein IFM89_024113 [Coptis chinensis]
MSCLKLRIPHPFEKHGEDCDSPSLTTNRGLLMEVVALEKVKLQAEQDENDGEANSNEKPVQLDLLAKKRLSLPNNVNILSRLPITTLIRIKYTCKLWLDIITDDPLFPELHFSLGVKNPGHVYGIRGSPVRIFKAGYAPQSKKYKYVTVLSEKTKQQFDRNVFTLGGESWRVGACSISSSPWACFL